MAKLPCVPESRMFTLKDTGETMSYDQVRQYLMENPDIWLGTKEGKEAGGPTKGFLNSPEAQQIISNAKKNGTYLKAPNGKPTNLSETQWVQVRTKSFKEWFGDWENDLDNSSQVVDKNGEPLVVYHGSNRKERFKTFDSYAGESFGGFNRFGAWFTSDINMAKAYAMTDVSTKSIGNVYSVFLNIRNPWLLNGMKGFIELENRYKDKTGIENVAKATKKDNDKFKEYLVLSGKDGILIDNFGGDSDYAEYFNGGKYQDMYVSLESNQIENTADDVIGGKEVAMPKAAEVQVEQYKPITKKNIEIGKFSKDEALDYYEDEKELDSGRMSTYISSMTVDVMDEDGNSIGNLIRLKDEDGIATYQATDIDGNELTLDEFDTKDEAIQALLDAHNKQAEKEFNKEQKRLAKEREKQAAKKQPSPDRVEQYLQGLLDQTKNVTGLNAALYTGAVKAMQAAYRLSKDVAKAIQAGIDYLVSKGLSQEEATAEMEIIAAPIRKKAEGETKPEAETETETEAETETGKKPLRELPEQEGSKIKAILGRSYQATTSEKVAKAIEKIGLFRIPINIDEALERGKQLVKELGFDGAYEVFQDLSPTIFADGIYLDEATRIGVFGALCEELQAKIDDVNTTPGQVLDYAEKLAEVQSKGGKLVSGGAILMRVWQAVLNRTTVPYQYERRVKEWKALFPNSPITAEMEKRLKDAEAKFIELDKKFKDLLAKQKEYEESQAINDIKEGIEEEKKSKKKVPTSILKQLADRVRKLSTTRPSMFTAATPASLVWDAAVEAVATALEAGASVEMAIRKGVDVIIKSPWYKKLSKADQKKAEGEFVNHYASLSEDELGGVEIVNDSIVVPHKLIRYYVEQGITDIDKIAEDIVETLKEDNPNITVRDVRDAITGYAKKTKRKTRPQIDKEIDMLKREGKLQSELEDIQNGIKKEKNPQARATLSDRAKNLTEEIDKIHQELFGHTKRQLTDEQRLAGYKKRAKKAIAELERRKREGDYSKKERRPPVDFDQEAKDIEFEKYLLQEEWEQMVEDESQRLESLSEKSIKSFLTVWGISRWLTVGFDLGVFGIQASMLMFNNAKTTARALANGVKAFKSMSNYRRLESEMKNNRMYMDAKEAGLKLYSLKDEASLKGDMIALATANTAWDSMGSGIAKLLPKKVSTPFKNYWKSLNPFGALERSQAAFMNTLLMGMYASTANIAALKGITSYKQDPEVFKQAAKVTNTLARRTSLGGLENSKAFMRSMNFLFFSAQNWASLLKLTTPLILHEIGAKRAGARNWKELSPIQRVALTTLGKWLAATVATTILVKLLSGWDENDDLDEEEKKKEGVITVNVNDARRSDFMKIRVGSQTIDPFSGLAQNIILQTRLLAELFGKRGFVSTQTGIEKNLGEDAVPSPLGLFGRQIEGKLQPSTRLLYMSIAKNVEGQPWYIRQNYISGQEVDLRQEFKDATTNLTIKSAKESFDEQNTGWAALFSALAVLGYGISRDERLEEMSIKRQAQETLNPERKKMAYEKAFRKYAKEGDVVLAKKMFKKIVDKEENKRPVAYDMFNEIKSDNIPGQYFFPSIDIDELFEVLATEKPIDVKSMSESKAARMQKINALTPEMRERIKSDYGVQYKKLMAAAEILNSLAIPSKADPNVKIDWVKKADSVNWVKEYKKSIGKETEPK